MNDVATSISGVRALMAARALKPHFQPICDIRTPGVFGYESLIRGPEGSPLQRPDDLFAAARAEGCELELELHCASAAMLEFARKGLPGKVFINMSAAALLSLRHGEVADRLRIARGLGLLPSRIVMELTEHVRAATDTELRDALEPLRSMGIGLALDDFGDGHSSLKQWTLLKPDYVKVDKHFVQGISSSNEHLEILRVYLYVAERFKTALIAEGIENPADMAVIRELAVSYGQGYLVGRPTATPSREIAKEAMSVLSSPKIAVLPESNKRDGGHATVDNFMFRQNPVEHTTTISQLEAIFEESKSLGVVAVVNGSKPIGLINRQSFVSRIARPFQRELHGRKPCTMFMNDQPSIVERGTPVEQLFDIMKGEDQRYLVDGFIVCEDGRYAGVATGERVVRALTEYRVEAARHANPLTSLPGNIPISSHIQRLLRRAAIFTACYFDLANFKPFNDVYGYWRGDEMIRLLAVTLTTHSDARHDFVGHVGGDDFVVLYQSEDWEDRCRRIQSEFNNRAMDLFDPKDRETGFIQTEDRRGMPARFPLTTVIIGAALIKAGMYHLPEDVASAAAAAKRKAKQVADKFFIQLGTNAWQPEESQEQAAA